jgi:hypothetical protein
LHETVAEPEPVTLDGLNDPQARPGEEVMLKVTVPVNPLTATTATVEVADWPAFTAAGDVVVRLNSWNRKIAATECDREPLVPVIVRV